MPLNEIKHKCNAICGLCENNAVCSSHLVLADNINNEQIYIS